ncbi:MAG TPA: magnesium transporter [bacterium]|nr:magnesium transporter [bacterium]
MYANLLKPEIQEFITNRDLKTLRTLLDDWLPQEIAMLIDGLSAPEDIVVFRLLERDTAARVFELLPYDKQEDLLKALARDQAFLAKLLSDLSPDDRTALLGELPGEITQQLLGMLDEKDRKVATTLLGYPPESIGRLMTTEYIAVREEWPLQRVFNHIRRTGRDAETLNVIYVVDKKGQLIDDLHIRLILLADPKSKIADIMDRHFVALRAMDDRESAVQVFREYDRTALPVIDSNGILIGIVTVDDVLDVMQEEVTEDIQKIGGSEALDEPYLRIALPTMIQKRARWLVALFLGEMLTASAMGYFEAEIARAVVLALFIPLIISSGGNSGSQAATLVIRAMAIGEVRLSDWWRVMHREILSGLSLGLILGTIGLIRVTIWQHFFHLYGPHWFLIALTVGLSLIGVVLWGTLAGSMLPFLLRKLGTDPAASSAPFVATLVDVTGLVIYFSMAALILGGILL